MGSANATVAGDASFDNVAIAPAVDWSRWRGSVANGVAYGQEPPIHWSREENIIWSANLPGWGTSSLVVFHDRIFVNSETDSAAKPSLLTLCFYRLSGRELLQHDFGSGSLSCSTQTYWGYTTMRNSA